MMYHLEQMKSGFEGFQVCMCIRTEHKQKSQVRRKEKKINFSEKIEIKLEKKKEIPLAITILNEQQ